ncbi:putative baseplate assembly protein [Microbacterium sp. SS28]|uniref:putative baseplate assembly protein n=1 Tax=Microbacterium sp. SS28 TaxID=2919948 RepID=UPI001FA9FAEF|nr:putative baseplate assembly protein [Microbacterium sp. SS28]
MTCYTCGDRRRLTAVKLAGLLNGIEFLEVRDHDEGVQALRQRTLVVRLLLAVPAGLDRTWIEIEGGERIRPVEIEWAKAATALTAAELPLVEGYDDPSTLIVVRTKRWGDFSLYRLRIRTPGTDDPPTGFDPLLASVPFSFKVECPSDLDCEQPCTCPPGVHHPPPIDYLAKDYQGFRRVMLERMALLAPGWTERSSADVGVMLVELLAYAADELSYRQDAVATEAYLGTARSRVSLRRHARLVDYRVHDGAAARVWARIKVADGATDVPLAAHTRLLTRVSGIADGRLKDGTRDHERVLDARPVEFQTVHAALLDHDHAEMRFWTWGRLDATLRPGSTSATLRGDHPALRAGEVLILAETVSPSTRIAADADPARRFAVRLTEVRSSKDPSGMLFDGGVEDVTEIRWHDEDALPAALCLAVDGTETAGAWGNVVLADHGATVTSDDGLGELLGTVPASRLVRAAADCDDEGERVPPRFRPGLRYAPLTRVLARERAVLATAPLTPTLRTELSGSASKNELQALFAAAGIARIGDEAIVRGAGRLHSLSFGGGAWLLREEPLGTLQVLEEWESASRAREGDPRDAVASVVLTGVDPASGPNDWEPSADLIASDGAHRAFVVEQEHDGTVFLRFGDDEHGARPPEGTEFRARYRVGNGTAGNIGRESLAYVVDDETDIVGVVNPLAAFGGIEPETGDEIRRDAPATLSIQERAVTASDYAAKAGLYPGVAKAEATFRWTGSWRTVFVTADRRAGRPVDASFETGLRVHLERFRMAGYDLEVTSPVFVPLEVALRICVSRRHHRSPVARDVRDVLSDGMLSDGRLGLFHPDRFTFGQSVYLSSILAAVHSVPGVESVDVVTFQRQHEPWSSGIASGVIPMGRLEIARLDDDPSFPERGVLELTYGGGS